MFWVISVYFNVRNILPKSGTFPPGHPVYYTVLNVLTSDVAMVAFPLYAKLTQLLAL